MLLVVTSAVGAGGMAAVCAQDGAAAPLGGDRLGRDDLGRDKAAEADKADKDDAPAKNERQPPMFTVETLRGRVVFAAEATERRHGVKSAPEAKERVLALETGDGKLYPLIEDVRGRAFRADKTLRDFEVELLVRRFEGSPLRQIIGVYAIKKDGKYEVDYWCDVCAIAMFELKPCECCQAMNQMRLRRVEEQKAK